MFCCIFLNVIIALFVLPIDIVIVIVVVGFLLLLVPPPKPVFKVSRNFHHLPRFHLLLYVLLVALRRAKLSEIVKTVFRMLARPASHAPLRSSLTSSFPTLVNPLNAPSIFLTP